MLHGEPWRLVTAHPVHLAGRMAAWALWQWLRGPSTQEERWIGGRIVAQAPVHGLLGAAALCAVAGRPRRRR